jgi:plasmid stabilization system protein ParE
VEKAELVANFPGIGTRLRVEPEGDVRMILYGHYRIAYRVSSRQATLLGSRAA